MDHVEEPTLTKRWACDRCRSKRVRCPRASDNAAQCSRCINDGARCVTGAPGNPGRPRKARHIVGPSPESPSVSVSASSMAEYWAPPHSTSLSGQNLCGTEASPPLPVTQPPRWLETGPGAGTPLLSLADDLGRAPNTPFHSSEHMSKYSSVESTSTFWSAPSLTFTEENPATSTEPTIFDELSSPPQHQGSLNALDHLDMLHPGLSANEKGSMYPYVDPFDGIASPYLSPQPSVASRLVRLREKVDLHATSMASYFSDPQRCVEGRPDTQATGTEPALPVAVLLDCIKEFTGIIQSLRVDAPGTGTPNHDHDHSVMADGQASLSLSTETALLMLCCYIALMRLCDSLFLGVCHYFDQMAPEALKSMKVKAAFRIGGVSSLQDMPAKAYAASITEIIRNQMRQLEHCLGIPAAYRLAGEGAGLTSQTPIRGIFASGNRRGLLHVVMEQEDIKAYRGNKSCVQSIQENLERTMAFFSD